MNRIYEKIIESKTHSLLPVMYNNKTIESKYNPEVEAERNLQGIPASNFYIILGVGSGILLNKLVNTFPNAFFLAVEKTQEDIDFLCQIPTFDNLKKKSNVCFSSVENISNSISEHYLPSFYGNLFIYQQKIWIQENSEIITELQNKIQQGLDYVKQDFSVQAHFGKIWHKNIFNNLKLLENFSFHEDFDFDKNKTAAIIAAGPSFDKTIEILKSNKNNYFIIATDTAYSSLIKNNIIPDFVVSIDAQNISHNHFIQDTNLFSKSKFIFDLSSNSSTCQHVFNNGGKIIFAATGHPLSEYIYNFENSSLIKLYSGSGTVTISALDFAIKCGFKKIEIFGADFSYNQGKAYTKGTYLDSLYNKKSTKFSNIETTYDKLQFRTELIKVDSNIFTTNTLNNYRLSILDYMNSMNVEFTYKNFIYEITNQNFCTLNSIKSPQNLYKRIIKTFSANQNINKEKKQLFDLNNEEITLLPLISWLRLYDNKNNDFNYFLKSAYSFLPRD